MSKSNPVHLWRFGRTTALIFTQKWLNRAKTGVLHGTLKIFPRSNKSVSRVYGTQLTKINWKIKNISSGLVTRRLYFFQKRATFWPKFPSWGIWPICIYDTITMTLVMDCVNIFVPTIIQIWVIDLVRFKVVLMPVVIQMTEEDFYSQFSSHWSHVGLLPQSTRFGQSHCTLVDSKTSPLAQRKWVPFSALQCQYLQAKIRCDDN